jgi:hypothetical protein
LKRGTIESSIDIVCTNPRLVFEVASSPPISTAVVGLALFAASAAMVLLRRRFVVEPMAPVVAFTAALVCAMVYSLELLHWRDGVRDARSKGVVVEGIVERLRPEPWAGHAGPERFNVGEHYFEYSYFSDTPFFNDSAAHGGPLRNGVPVRILAVNHSIARLELCE